MALTLAIQGHARFKRLPAASTLTRWTRAAVGPATDAELTLRFVGVAEGRRLNQAYRRKDEPTNVLTFAYSRRPVLRADIVLCVPVVRREARAQGKRDADHFAHLLVHGVLHAQGEGHDRPAAARRMEAREVEVLERFGIADPYAARDRAARG